MSGFQTKRAAEQYAGDQEAAIRANRYVDPRAGAITVQEWVNLWFPSLDLEPSTLSNYRYFIQSHILPAFGPRPLASLTYEEIAAWEKDLVQVHGYARRTAVDARATFATVLSDAVPGRIQINPAAKKKAKGRKGVRRIAQAAEKKKAWADPLAAFLYAERCAALTGRWVDFVKQIAFVYTGARWSELLALGPGSIKDGLLNLDTKLYELSGRFYTGHPKDGSIRVIDLPPFLVELLSTIEARRCTCSPREMGPGDPPWCEGGEYLFLGPDGGHPRRSTYGRRVVRPAADGWHPARGNKGAMPVLADVFNGWPGALVAPWPAAVKGQPYEAPRLAELSRGHKTLPSSTPIATWLPVARELTVHGLRHSHQTWMAEDRIADVLRDKRMGHTVEDDARIASLMRDHYTHVSEQMRAELIAALERRWVKSLVDRVDLEERWNAEGIPRRSSAPGVDDLLRPYRESRATKIGSPLAPKSGHRRQRKRPLPDWETASEQQVGDTGIEPVTSSV
ncbi:tyrosine-type recombinase/integrase [Microtetraspora malaysiensis]|uniref:tyrosine-type recombinase/integrase n=1 Tax=Microtetraspora malaysiensis TaxID=161358 RepID=UPI003D8AD4C6